MGKYGRVTVIPSFPKSAVDCELAPFPAGLQPPLAANILCVSARTPREIKAVSRKDRKGPQRRRVWATALIYDGVVT
jgi:hypothetical protein